MWGYIVGVVKKREKGKIVAILGLRTCILFLDIIATIGFEDLCFVFRRGQY